MTEPIAPAVRVAEFLRLLAAGHSQRSASRLAGVSKETLWRWRRSKPEFAAALHDADTVSRDIRKAKRDEAIREEYARLSLELARNEGRKERRGGFLVLRQRRLLAKLHGINTSIYPGCSPSHTAESDNAFERITQRQVRAKMQADFAERRRQKRGEPPAGNAGTSDDAATQPSTLPPGSRHMSARQVQLLLGYVATGQTVDGAARKLGLSRDDVLDHREATPGFALLLGEALGAGAEAQERHRQQRKAQHSPDSDSQGEPAPSGEPSKKGRARVLF